MSTYTVKATYVEKNFGMKRVDILEEESLKSEFWWVTSIL
jgi:hypothetical protein